MHGDNSYGKAIMEHSDAAIFGEARRRLVEQRRTLIKAIAGDLPREQTAAHINLVIRIQSAIDVVDRAIEDEKRVAHKHGAPLGHLQLSDNYSL